MEAQSILHVVVEQDGAHALYLRGGDVVRWYARTGRVSSVRKLPSDYEVEKARQDPTQGFMPGKPEL
jgi:hypothetical protein